SWPWWGSWPSRLRSSRLLSKPYRLRLRNLPHRTIQGAAMSVEERLDRLEQRLQVMETLMRDVLRARAPLEATPAPGVAPPHPAEGSCSNRGQTRARPWNAGHTASRPRQNRAARGHPPPEGQLSSL